MSTCRENKYVPPGQRNREPLSWGTGRQNSPRLGQGSVGPSAPRAGPHDYSPNSGTDQRVVNGGMFNAELAIQGFTLIKKASETN